MHFNWNSNGTNCAPLLADLFFYSYQNESLHNMIRSGYRRLARHLYYRYIDDSIVFNNKEFLDYFKEIYPSQLAVEKANILDPMANYLYFTFIIDSRGKLSVTKMMILTSTMLIFYSFPAAYHLALLMVYTFRSS